MASDYWTILIHWTGTSNDQTLDGDGDYCMRYRERYWKLVGGQGQVGRERLELTITFDARDPNGSLLYLLNSRDVRVEVVGV